MSYKKKNKKKKQKLDMSLKRIKSWVYLHSLFVILCERQNWGHVHVFIQANKVIFIK